MKRLHVHLTVADLAAGIRFYSTLFATAPSVAKDDYAKWMLDDPRVNFAISTHGDGLGLNHLGMQVEDAEELAEMNGRLHNLQDGFTTEQGTACCYAVSDKYWTNDPQGIPWETFHTLSSIPVFGAASQPEDNACCVSATIAHRENAAQCCTPSPRDNSAAKEKCC